MKNPFTARAVALCVLVATSLGLVSCIKREDPFAVVPCPYIGVLDDAAEITRFKYGGQRDISDIEFKGRIARIDFTCKKPENKEVVIGKATIHAEFERGMTTTIDRQFFKLFLVLSERDEKIIDKSEFVLDVEFKEGRRKTKASTSIKGIRVPTDGDVPAEYHNIYIGFQLSPAEVAYNRTKN